MTTKPQRKPPRTPRKPWRRPQIKSGKLFESNSLACGKNTPATDECTQFATQS